jgi:roadblock/LC7 domain-containing protein
MSLIASAAASMASALMASRSPRESSQRSVFDATRESVKGACLEDPAAMEMAHWFCSAATTMFTAMAAAMDLMEAAGSWRPMAGWVYSGGDYAITVYRDKFVFAESAKIKSFDEIRELLHQLDS